MTEDTERAGAKSVGTVLRVVRLLKYVAEAPSDITVRQLATMLKLPPSTVHRLLQILSLDDLIERDPQTHRYRSGIEFIRIAQLVASRSNIGQIAEPHLRAVVEKCDEACVLIQYLPARHQVFVMSAVNSKNPLRYDIELFKPHSPLWGATGRSVLAFLPEEEQRATFETREPSPTTGEVLKDFDQLARELAAIRQQGYVLTRSQNIAGAVGIGAPIYNSAGRVIGSLLITLPEMRYSEDVRAVMPEILRTHARMLSKDLGYQG